MSDDRLSVLARRVRICRSELGLSAEAAAVAGGLSAPTWTRVERGVPVQAATYRGVERALGWQSGRVDELLAGDGVVLRGASGGATLAEVIAAHELLAAGLWAHPGAKRHHCERCFYCRAPLPTRHEHDHYPTPERAGGTRVVATCLNCHDLKDRTALDQWPAVDREAAYEELQREHWRELAALAATYGPVPPENARTLALCSPTARWAVWSPLARLLCAKLLSLAFDGDDPRIPRQPTVDLGQHTGG